MLDYMQLSILLHNRTDRIDRQGEQQGNGNEIIIMVQTMRVLVLTIVIALNNQNKKK